MLMVNRLRPPAPGENSVCYAEDVVCSHIWTPTGDLFHQHHWIKVSLFSNLSGAVNVSVLTDTAVHLVELIRAQEPTGDRTPQDKTTLLSNNS